MTIIAIATYGSHRVKHPNTGQMVSAYKIGYSSAASAVLLSLYGDQARDVSPRQASYHYVQIDAEISIRHGYILLRLSEVELAQAEAITRQTHRAAVYRWRDSDWYELPTLRSAEYQLTTGRSGPGFNPTGMRMVSAASGEAGAAVSGILVEKSQRSSSDLPWFWLRGDTYPYRDILKRWGCRWSKRQKAWYFVGADLPDAVQQLVEQVNQEAVSDEDSDPCSIKEVNDVLSVPIPEIPIEQSEFDPHPSDTEADPEAEVPRIRIIPPDLSDSDESDPLRDAVRQTKTGTLPVLQSTTATNGRRNLSRIPQSACGELTGSITGNVWCYGWAVHEGVCVYVNFGGPRMAVEAIRARFSKGEIVNCVPWDAPSIELTAGEGNSTMYSAFMQNIPEAKFTSLILCHELLTAPNYGGKSTTFIFHVSDEQAMAQLRHHVTKLVKVPVFADWTGYLWQAGQSAMLVRPTRTGGDVKLYTVDLDADAWTRLITGGLAQGIIALQVNPGCENN